MNWRSSTTPGHQTCYLDAQYGHRPGAAALNDDAGRDQWVRLICREPVLAGLLGAVLKPLGGKAPMPAAGAAVPALIEVGADGDGEDNSYWIKLPGMGITRTLSRGFVRRLVLRQLLLQRHGSVDTAAILHASAVELGGKAVLIAGRSGAGKTTLTAALLHAGAGYLADDLVALSADGRRAGDFPVALALKRGSWPLVAPYFPKLADCKTLSTRRLQVRYLCVTKAAACAKPRQREIAAIILPQFGGGQDLQIERLAPEETFSALLDSGSGPEGAPPSMRSLVALANGTKAWRLRFNDLNRAVARIVKLAPAS